jgi:outer membrane protein OmpA-like peptidoglycan-associated protein
MRAAPANFAPYTNNKKKKLLEIEDVNIDKPKAIKVFYNLAQSYRFLNDYETAEKWYAKVLAVKSPGLPLTRLWHAICLRALGHYPNAEKELKRFIKDNDKPENKDVIDIANNELNNVNYIRQQIETKRPPAYALHKLKGDFNQIEGAYAPYVFNDTLVFTSARIVDTVNKDSKVNMHINHLFSTAFNTSRDSVVGKASIIKFPSRTAANEGTPTFSPSANTLYFTRWEPYKGNSNSSIYVSKKKNDSTWDEPVKLDEKINVKGYNSNQPFLTDDGKYLLYASDRPDGLGKYDIWAAPIDSEGNVGEPFNLKNINTKDDDKAPFYHTNAKTLVFSSNGRVGMGGFDLYSATGDITSLQTPVDLGAPINSIKDDDYFFSASKDSLMKKAYVSSDRKSQCCLEIFSVERLPKKIFKQRIDGLVSDCKTGRPLPYASITVNNEIDTTRSQKILTKTDGLFLVNLNDSIAGLTIKRKGYTERVQSFRYNPDLYQDTTYLIEVCLTKAKKIYYKQYLDATLIDCETKKPISKAVITLLNSSDSSKNKITASSAKGAFDADLNDSIDGLWFEKNGYYDKEVHFKLESDSLESDTVYKVTYCMQQFHPEDSTIPLQITSIPITEKIVNIINKSDSVIVHFDFNKTELKDEEITKLDNILSILKAYPYISLELDITGHTDSKGSDEINNRIGRERALACLDYMIQRGVSESRLKLKSPGKKDPVAPNTINHKDNPAGRALNRRAIIKVKAKIEVPKNK